MVITLYKGCRLNKSYCEVLDTIAPHTYSGVQYNNALEGYLSTLQKITVETAEDIYGTNKGVFSFELDIENNTSFYEINYMKVVDSTGKFSRYYFVNSITVVDALAVINYEEDVWANYSASMHVRNSLLTRSRSLKYGNYTIPFYKLGMEYEGNNALSLTSIGTASDLANDGKVVVVAQIQFYQLGVGTGTAINKTNVITRTVVVYQPIAPSPVCYLGVDEYLTQIITEIKSYQSEGKIIFNSTYATRNNIDTTKDWYYEISNFVLCPLKFGIEIAFNEPESVCARINIQSLGTIAFADLTRCNSIYTSSMIGLPVKTKTFTVAHDFHILGIGTYSNLFATVQNGTDIDVDILLSCDDYNFNIYMSYQNQIVNITNDFALEVPISVQSADATQQAKTSRQIEMMNSVFQMGKGVLNIYSGSNSITSGVAETTLGASTGQLGNLVAGSNMIASGVNQIYGGITGIAKGIANMVVLNKPLYRSNKGTFSTSIGSANAYYGLFVFSIDEDNETEVQANIDNAGYVVNEIVGDLLQNMANANDKPSYNVMAFGFVNNYGAFPEDIRERFVDILSNGFKIWYDVASYIAS